MYHCNRVPTLKLQWDGESWKRVSAGDEKLYYRVRLGRDLCNLIDRDAIKEDVLNSTQAEYVAMYRQLFSE